MSRMARALLGLGLVVLGLAALSAGVNDQPPNGGLAAAGVIMMGVGIGLVWRVR